MESIFFWWDRKRKTNETSNDQNFLVQRKKWKKESRSGLQYALSTKFSRYRTAACAMMTVRWREQTIKKVKEAERESENRIVRRRDDVGTSPSFSSCCRVKRKKKSMKTKGKKSNGSLTTEKRASRRQKQRAAVGDKLCCISFPLVVVHVRLLLCCLVTYSSCSESLQRDRRGKRKKRTTKSFIVVVDAPIFLPHLFFLLCFRHVLQLQGKGHRWVYVAVVYHKTGP